MKNFSGQKFRSMNKFMFVSTTLFSLGGMTIYWQLNQRRRSCFSATLASTSSLDNFDYRKTNECNQIVSRYKEEFGIPGIIVGVSHNGTTIYSKGFGYSDVENGVKAHPDTVVRIASISKPLTTTIAAKLYENNRLDLDKSVNSYLSFLPEFKWNNKSVTITPRQLMCHLSGIRHYSKTLESENDKIKERKLGDQEFEEFLLNKNFKTTREALEIFINDKLLYEPGDRYYYTTHGFTLLSAVLEKCSEDRPFAKLLSDLFSILELNQTYLDQNDPIVPNRSKYYMRNDKKRLVNVPFVDNSCKWAGGGLMSTTNDLLKFGNHMLTFYQNDNDEQRLFLKQSTVKSLLWKTQSKSLEKEEEAKQLDCFARPDDQFSYGCGWCLCHDGNQRLRYAYHTGGACGAISCLMIIPTEEQATSESVDTSNQIKPNGLVISVLCNSQDASEIVKLCLGISKIFLQN